MVLGEVVQAQQEWLCQVLFWVLVLGLVTLGIARNLNTRYRALIISPGAYSSSTIHSLLRDCADVIFHDALEGNVHVSNDEGKTWRQAEGVPKHKITVVFEHPFHDRYAFGLSDDTTHYRTEDRGKTWRFFATPAPPALTAHPLSFHSDPKKFGKDFKHEAHEDLVYCISFDEKVEESAHLHAARLFSSTDFSDKERKVEDLGMDAKSARGVVAVAIVSKSSRSGSPRPGRWSSMSPSTPRIERKLTSPTPSNAKLHENSYTIVESTTHSLSTPTAPTLSNLSNTSTENEMGFVDYERVYGVDGIGLASVVANAQEVESRGSPKRLRSKITFDDGRTWQPSATKKATEPSAIPDDQDTQMQALSWKMVAKGGSLVRVWRPGKRYSVDMGKTWETYDFGISIRTRALTSLPDSTPPEIPAPQPDLPRIPTRSSEKCAKNQCKESHFECDYNHVWNGDKCEQTGPEPVSPKACQGDPETEKYWGSSGYRKLNFKSRIVRFAHFKGSATILVRLLHHSIWQSSNQGYTWNQVHPDSKFLAFCHHKYSNGRAYLITNANQVWYTTDTGRSWHNFNARNPPNTFEARVLHFSPSDDDYLIRTGDSDCPGRSHHAEAYFSRNHGRDWTLIEKYFRNCAFAEDVNSVQIPPRSSLERRLRLVAGGNFHARQKKLFESVVGFTKFLEVFGCRRVGCQEQGVGFTGLFGWGAFCIWAVPASMSPSTHAYTALESATGALFLHMTMAQNPPPLDGIAIANIDTLPAAILEQRAAVPLLQTVGSHGKKFIKARTSGNLAIRVPSS
ncbi:hypothetical protein BKA70DRAFT_1403939 [Coprinopsis sp. MPI-PUGE-AT-0042]|nr:hypothetical protein BKA70DRAFT_1403939 [Coprinopsis sp. MPI-PUGE-AT-0042]